MVPCRQGSRPCGTASWFAGHAWAAAVILQARWAESAAWACVHGTPGS